MYLITILKVKKQVKLSDYVNIELQEKLCFQLWLCHSWKLQAIIHTAMLQKEKNNGQVNIMSNSFWTSRLSDHKKIIQCR